MNFQKIFAIIALIAILLGVIGTGWFVVTAPTSVPTVQVTDIQTDSNDTHWDSTTDTPSDTSATNS